MTHAQTIERHLAMFQAGDVEGLMLDYAEDCVLMVDDQVMAGHAAVRPFFQHVFTAMFPGGVKLAMESTATSGDVTLIKWSARTPDLVVSMGTDTLVLRDGKIRVHTAALKIDPPGPEQQNIWT